MAQRDESEHWKMYQSQSSESSIKTDEEAKTYLSFHDDIDDTEDFKEEILNRVEHSNSTFVSELSKSKLDESKSRALREKEEQTQFEISEDSAIEDSINEIDCKRKKIEEKRKTPDHDKLMTRQHTLKLTALSILVESQIEEDRKLVEELETVLMSSGLSDDIQSRVKTYKDQLNQLKLLEAKTRRELGLLFSEDAARMWTKQSRLWNEDQLERGKTIRDFFDQSKETIRVRIQSRQSLIDSNGNGIDLSEMDLQEDDCTPISTRVSMEERTLIKTELEKSRAGWTEEGHDQPDGDDFRRKKVQWFF